MDKLTLEQLLWLQERIRTRRHECADPIRAFTAAVLDAVELFMVIAINERTIQDAKDT